MEKERKLELDEAFGAAMATPDIFEAIVAEMMDWNHDLTEAECYEYLNMEVFNEPNIIPIR